jgi:hypothetical protein
MQRELSQLDELKRLFWYSCHLSDLDQKDILKNWEGNSCADFARRFLGPLSDIVGEGRNVLEAQTLAARKYDECRAATACKRQECSAEMALSEQAASRAVAAGAAAEELIGWILESYQYVDEVFGDMEAELAMLSMDPGWD